MVKGFIVDSSYTVEDEQAYVLLYGRLENEKSFLVKKAFNPYFYIKSEYIKDAEKFQNELDFELKKTDFKDFEGNKLAKITLTNPKNVPKLRHELSDNNIGSYEADIRFTTRFLIDNDIKSTLYIKGEYERGERVDRVYEEPEVKGVLWDPKLKTISIDIETSPDGRDLYCIGMSDESFRKVLLLREVDKSIKDTESFKDERELLERFRELILEYDPDIITGWNVIDFDFSIIQKLFKKHNITFDIARKKNGVRIFSKESFFEESNMKIPGRVVLDGITLMKINYVSLNDYKLDTFAKHYLGSAKYIGAENKGEEIVDAFRNNPKKLVEYNLEDTRLVLKVLEKTNVLDLTIARSLITGIQLDRVKGSVITLDSLYLRELKKRKIAAPNTAYTEREARIRGGFVRDSVPGIYENIIVMDFKSIYPSIMRTFNIDPLSYVSQKKEGLIEAPNGAYFRREEAIIPKLIEYIWEKRNEAKKRKDEIGSYAFKVLMNSIFGVLANPMCRFYNLDIANAITHFGQKFIKLVSTEAEKYGYDVIYGDTDSIFVNSKEKDYKKAFEKGEEIQDWLNDFVRDYIEKNYDRNSYLELEFEKVYKKFFMPRIRGSEAGAKKRYAGILEKDGEDKLDFVGLEFVRGDWTELAKKLQAELLMKVFYGEDVDKYINGFIKDLKNGKFDDLLVYQKNIRKPVDEYTKTTPPHIQAARKINRKSPGSIRYVQTVNGPEPVEEIKNKLDYNHYIEKQVKPIADSILEMYGREFDDVVAGSQQKNLFDF